MVTYDGTAGTFVALSWDARIPACIGFITARSILFDRPRSSVTPTIIIYTLRSMPSKAEFAGAVISPCLSPGVMVKGRQR